MTTDSGESESTAKKPASKFPVVAQSSLHRSKILYCSFLLIRCSPFIEPYDPNRIPPDWDMAFNHGVSLFFLTDLALTHILQLATRFAKPIDPARVPFVEIDDMSGLPIVFFYQRSTTSTFLSKIAKRTAAYLL